MEKQTVKVSGTVFRSVLAALLAAAAMLAACARVGVKLPAEAPPGLLRGILYADNTLGVPLDSAEVRSGEATVKARPDGTFAFPAVAPGKNFVVAEKRFGAGPVRRVLGVATVHVSDFPVQIRIRMRDATLVDDFCQDCHPMKKDVTRKDQIYRDIHPSGVVPKKANKPEGRYDEMGRVTCESCHTVHRATPYPHFTTASYADGKLCLQCH